MIAFGFLASQEVKDAGVGNLGLQDREHSRACIINVLISRFQERMALRWVQKYIHSFGGDPSKVTIYVKRPLNLELADIFKLG
jgi:acetylcholinesterase